MPDIKSEIKIEKSLALNEKPAAGLENLKQKPGGSVEREKLKGLEQATEKVINEIIQTENHVPPAIGPIGGVSLPQAKQQKKIESVLSQGLQDIYLNLEPAKRQEFKKAGEETAKKINQLLTKAKVNIGDIINLIKKWLSLIPGLNKYFLEQEAKIKADEIMKIKR